MNTRRRYRCDAVAGRSADFDGNPRGDHRRAGDLDSHGSTATVTWLWFFMLQGTPSFDEANRWVANNGFAVVIALSVILPGVALFGWLVRGLVNGMATRIDHAVEYFTQKLDSLSARQEQSLDRLDDRLESMTTTSTDNANGIAQALREIARSQSEQAAAMAALNESNRILLTFMTQNMSNIQAHRSVVEPVITGIEGQPPVGVMRGVEEQA
jgi:hypothetical protein